MANGEAQDASGDWLAVREERITELATELVTEVLGRKAGLDARVSVEVVPGRPAQALIDASAGADLLVLGSRGHGGFRELVLGSVSQQCVHHAACPVTVVPAERPRRAPDAARPAASPAIAPMY